MIFSKGVILPKLNFEEDEIRKIPIKTLCTYYRQLSPQARSTVALSSMINFPYLILGNNFILLLRASGVTCLFLLNFDPDTEKRVTVALLHQCSASAVNFVSEKQTYDFSQVKRFEHQTQCHGLASTPFNLYFYFLKYLSSGVLPTAEIFQVVFFRNAAPLIFFSPSIFTNQPLFIDDRNSHIENLGWFVPYNRIIIARTRLIIRKNYYYRCWPYTSILVNQKIEVFQFEKNVLPLR